MSQERHSIGIQVSTSSVFFILSLLLSILPHSTTAQVTTQFTDPASGITFERFFGARTQFGFGIALPAEPTTSFIGQLSFPLVGGNGWGGFSLTGDMEGPLLMAAWSDGAGNVVSSFRQAENEDDNPPEITGSFALRPIASGTSVNDTFLTFTFLCEGCLDATLGLGAAATAGDAEMGWALARTAVGNPTSSEGVLGFHDSGFGDFTARLGQARSTEFETWAALAGTAVAPSPGAIQATPNAGDGDDDNDDDDDDAEDQEDDDGANTLGNGQGGGGGRNTPGIAQGVGDSGRNTLGNKKGEKDDEDSDDEDDDDD